jgi:hypothetical protein
MGVAYMTVVVYIMTPYTHQLDDIKVAMIHLLGPGVIVTYLGFLALGMVPLPRRTRLTCFSGFTGPRAVWRKRRDMPWTTSPRPLTEMRKGNARTSSAKTGSLPPRD